jgi:hypothetical protein
MRFSFSDRLLMAMYFLIVWWRLKLRPGIIIPRYAPPADFSPAAVRYLQRMGFDHKTFTAAILNLAVRGVLQISERKEGAFRKKIYTLVPLRNSSAGLSVGEDLVRRELVGDGLPLTLRPNNHAKIQAAQAGLKTFFAEQMQGTLFKTNRRYWFPGVVGCFAALLMAILNTRDINGAGVALFGFALWFMLLVYLFQLRLFPLAIVCSAVGVFAAVMVLCLSPLPAWMVVLPVLLVSLYQTTNRFSTIIQAVNAGSMMRSVSCNPAMTRLSPRAVG